MPGGKRRAAAAAALPPDFLKTVKRLRAPNAAPDRADGTGERGVACRTARTPAPVLPVAARSLHAAHRRTPSPSPPAARPCGGSQAQARAPRAVPAPQTKAKAPRAVPAANFYGGATGGGCAEARARTARGDRLIQRLHVAVARYRRTDVFREFFLQREAVAFADAQADAQAGAQAGAQGAACVFARELDRTGKRKFFVTTYDECWRRLLGTPPGGRHFYEVVREHWPCYLYFDIEYSRELNPDTDGDAAMAAFIDFLPRGLRQLYPAHGFPVRREDVIDLDSSTDAKFSRHLIVRPHAAQIAFVDNIHMGACVRKLVDILHAEAAEGARAPSLDSIFVRTSAEEPAADGAAAERLSGGGSDAPPGGASSSADGKRTGARRPFIDMGVYTKNRCFRTFGSSKFGKATVLANARGSQDTIDQHGNEEQLFYNSLVCRLAHPLHLMTILSDPTLPPSVADTARHGGAHAARSAGAGTSTGASQAGSAHGADDVVETYGRDGQWAEGAFLGPEERDAWKAIGRHVVGVWNHRAGGAQGGIRSASWLGGASGSSQGSDRGEGSRQGRIVTLRIDGNRWCENIGRQHKSVRYSPLPRPPRPPRRLPRARPSALRACALAPGRLPCRAG